MFSATTSQKLSKVDTRTDDEIDHEIVTYLDRKDIDSWQLRKTLQTIHVCSDSLCYLLYMSMEVYLATLI